MTTEQYDYLARCLCNGGQISEADFDLMIDYECGRPARDGFCMRCSASSPSNVCRDCVSLSTEQEFMRYAIR